MDGPMIFNHGLPVTDPATPTHRKRPQYPRMPTRIPAMTPENCQYRVISPRTAPRLVTPDRRFSATATIPTITIAWRENGEFGTSITVLARKE